MAVSTVGLQTFWETTAVQGRKLMYLHFELVWQLWIQTSSGLKNFHTFNHWGETISSAALFPDAGQAVHSAVQRGVVQLGQLPAPCCCLPALLAFSKPSSRQSWAAHLFPDHTVVVGAFHGLSLSSISQLPSWAWGCC